MENVGGLSGITRKRVGFGIAIIVFALLFPLFCPNALAQSSKAFGPDAKFGVPAYNGIVTFGVNGNYSSAEFEGNNWVFTNLRLNGSDPLENFTISARNSNVTVYWHYVTTVYFPNERLDYIAEGKGEQMINMDVGTYGGSSVDWVILTNGTFVSNNWSVSHNGTVTVTGLTGNITIIYFGFMSQLGVSNLPFYEAHSVAIAVTVAVAVTIVVAVVVKVEVKRREEKELSRNA
jgi:hypothetical protein